MMPSSYSDTAIAVPTSAGVPPASPDLAPGSVIARFTAIQIAMHKRRPDMLSIISDARTSSGNLRRWKTRRASVPTLAEPSLLEEIQEKFPAGSITAQENSDQPTWVRCRCTVS